MSHPAADLLARAERAHRERRFDDSKTALVEAVEISRAAAPPQRPLAVALRRLGEAERRTDNPQGARAAYEEAVALMREDSEPLRLGHTLRHLGEVYQEQGQSDPARRCLEEAVAIYRDNEPIPSPNLANAVRALAVHLEEGGALDGAEPLWQEACGIYRSFGVHAGVAEACVRISVIVRGRGENALARRHLAEAEEAARQSEDPDTIDYVAMAAAEFD